MAKTKEYYSNLTAEELLEDDFFIESIRMPDASSESFWKEFLTAYPDKLDAFTTASDLIKRLRFQNVNAATGRKEKIWENIISKANTHGKVVEMKPRKTWWWAAAVIAGIAIISVPVFLNKNKTVTEIETGFAELKTIQLPDGSEITLNANSGIRYSNRENGKAREVWLKGEAFFEVKHLHQDGQAILESDRFIVHTGDADIEVLGTSFNVSNRKELTSVVLQTGKVKVGVTGGKNETIIMEPGEIVKYNNHTKLLSKNKTEITKYTAWKKKEILLNNTSVSEVIDIIENTFGYQVEVDKKELLSHQLSGTGTLSLENDEVLFKTLELLLNTEVIKNGNRVILKSR